MLNQFTWQHFLVAASVLALVWYVVVVLVFYRGKVSSLFGSGKATVPENRFRSTEALPGRWEQGMAPAMESTVEDGELMGRSKLPEGMMLVGSGDFGFSGGADREQQVGLVPDVLEELRSVFKLLAERDGTKRDFFLMMEGVRKSFPKISSSPNIGRINQFVADHAPFHLTAEELESLWE